MSKIVLHDLFTELPYACALDGANVEQRCAGCFSEIESAKKVQCPDGCKMINYCGEECLLSDQPFHVNECQAYKTMQGKHIEQFVRLLARLLTRQQVDNGVAHLSDDGFPSHVPDRCMDDLMSHQSDIEENDSRKKHMDWAMGEFCTAFADTSLVNDLPTVRRMYCVMWTNCFAVSGPMSMSKGHETSIGVALYLNVSRFNHSCLPDLHVEFDSVRIRLRFPDTIEGLSKREAMTSSKENFSNLTISYGFSGAFTADSYFPLRSQRRSSLQFCYYFECMCPLCGDDEGGLLETTASNFQCGRCIKPYVWMDGEKGRHGLLCCGSKKNKSGMQCVKLCDCKFDDGKPLKEYMRSVDYGSELKDLAGNWTSIMREPVGSVHAEKVIAQCAPILEVARRLWHPVENLRLIQLYERIFSACNVLVAASAKRGRLEQNLLKLALESGEATVHQCFRRSEDSYHAASAAYARDLAKVYETGAQYPARIEGQQQLRHKSDYRRRAAYWYKKAADTWEAIGDHAGVFVTTLREKEKRNEMLADAAE